MKISAQLLACALSAFAFLPTEAKMQRHSHRELARNLGQAEAKRSTVAYQALMYWGKQDGQAGACGLVHKDDELLVGLQHATFSTDSDTCGQFVEIRNTANNKTVIAPVYDSCKGCADSNDLVSSIATFEGLGGNLDDGILEVVWTFVDAPASKPQAVPAIKESAPIVKAQKVDTAKEPAAKPIAQKQVVEKVEKAPAKETAADDEAASDEQCEEYETLEKPVVEKPQQAATDFSEDDVKPAKLIKVEAKPAAESAANVEVKVEARPAPKQAAQKIGTASAEGFKLTHDLRGQDLLNFFHFETASGDNEGYAAWVDDKSLQYVNGAGNVVFATDDTPTVDARKTTRAVSNEKFSKGLFISRVTHMPSTYGSWPSMWMVGNPWPQAGEIDVLEGVGSFNQNAASVHTSAGCSMPADIISQTTSKFMLNSPQQTNCDAHATDTQGCGLRDDTPNTFGPGFNSVGGAYVAVLITDDVIKVHQWAGDSAPEDVKNGSPAPSTWGKPALYLPSTSCNISERFQNLQLVFSTNVCGRWASDLWHKDASYAGQKQTSAAATGVDSCYEYAHSHGKAWADAYFEVASIQIFG